MISSIHPLPFTPTESEKEKASYSYIMSVVALGVGLPIPIVNLVATAIIFLAFRNSSYFVKYHATQALISQCILFLFNSPLIYWTLQIFLFESLEVSDDYFAYLAIVGIINILELIESIYSSIQTRKGKHVKWFLISGIVDKYVKF